ncbi:MAG: YhbY family RNA-binding protein [Clostridiaceae bacterium]|nr:YhbY family RNA-binding protein [Clostridiaceae bacterium]
MLTSKQRAYLRALANPLPTTQQIGKDGVTDAVLHQAAAEIKVKELIKLRVLETAPVSLREASELLCSALGAEPVQCIGSRLVIYKRSPDKPVIVLP